MEIAVADEGADLVIQAMENIVADIGGSVFEPAGSGGGSYLVGCRKGLFGRSVVEAPVLVVLLPAGDRAGTDESFYEQLRWRIDPGEKLTGLPGEVAVGQTR